MSLVMKNDLDDLVRDRMKLPEGARIVRADFRITEQSDDVLIVGNVMVELAGETPADQDPGSEELTTESLPKRRGRKPGRSKAKDNEEKPSGASIKPKEIKIMRLKLTALKVAGKLSDNQIAALDSMKGVRAETMDIPMREQLRNIFEDVTASND